nr:MAG TPA: hypothetical protein [Caudoviricetes sp.]
MPFASFGSFVPFDVFGFPALCVLLSPALLKTCLPFTSYLRGIYILRGFCYYSNTLYISMVNR